MKRLTEKQSDEYWKVRTSKCDTIILHCSEKEVEELYHKNKITEYIPLRFYEYEPA